MAVETIKNSDLTDKIVPRVEAAGLGEKYPKLVLREDVQTGNVDVDLKDFNLQTLGFGDIYCDPSALDGVVLHLSGSARNAIRDGEDIIVVDRRVSALDARTTDSPSETDRWMLTSKSGQNFPGDGSFVPLGKYQKPEASAPIVRSEDVVRTVIIEAAKPNRPNQRFVVDVSMGGKLTIKNDATRPRP